MAKNSTESWTHTAWEEWCQKESTEDRKDLLRILEEGEQVFGCTGYAWIIAAGMLQCSGMNAEEQSIAVDMIRMAFGIDVFEEEEAKDWLAEVNRRGDKEAVKTLFRFSQDPAKLGKGWKKALTQAFAEEDEEMLLALVRFAATLEESFLPEVYSLITDVEYGAVQDGADWAPIFKGRKKRERDYEKRREELAEVRRFFEDSAALHRIIHSTK